MEQIIKPHPKPWCPDCGVEMELGYPAATQPWEPYWQCSR